MIPIKSTPGCIRADYNIEKNDPFVGAESCLPYQSERLELFMFRFKKVNGLLLINY